MYIYIYLVIINTLALPALLKSLYLFVQDRVAVSWFELFYVFKIVWQSRASQPNVW